MFPHQYIKGPGFVSDDAIDLIQNVAALFGVKSFKIEVYSRGKVWNGTKFKALQSNGYIL